MTDADRLSQLARKGEVTQDDLNIFKQIADEQSTLLVKWMTAFNSYESLEVVDNFSAQKETVPLGKFEDRIAQMKRLGRIDEALDMAEVAVQALHIYLDNQLLPRLKEVVRVNDAAQTASSALLESMMQQRKSLQEQLAELQASNQKQTETMQLLQKQLEEASDELALKQWYFDNKDAKDLTQDMQALIREVQKMFVADKQHAQPSQAEPDNNNDSDFIATKQGQHSKKKAVGIIPGVL